MMSGMGRVFRYDNKLPNPEIPNPKLAQRKLFADDRMIHPMAKIGLESTWQDLGILLPNTLIFLLIMTVIWVLERGLQ